MWGPCFGHKRATFWPFLRKGTTGYTWQCEIWHGTSLGTLIKIQEEPIWRTMWGPCFGHKRATFWPFLGKGATGYTQQCEIGHGTSLGTLIKIQEELILRTMWGPCFGHKRAIFWLFIGKGLQDTPSFVKFCMEHPLEHWLRFRKNQFVRSYEDLVLAIKEPYFGHV